MEDFKNKTVTVQNGRFKGEEFRIEDDVDNMPTTPTGTDLVSLSLYGNWAAKNALEVDKYNISDGPFYYGKIGPLGYIISKKDLGI